MGKMMADKIRELRERRGLTQEQLASLAEVDVRTVQRIEYGHTVRPSTLAQLVEALGRTPEDLQIEELQEKLAGLEEAVAPYRCPYCKSELVETVQVPLDAEEKDWDMVEAYRCGYRTLAGEVQRLCPRDPEFPPLEAFEFQYQRTKDGWWCEPVVKADASEQGRRLALKARQLGLTGANGKTQEDARQWVEIHYERLTGKPWWERKFG